VILVNNPVNSSAGGGLEAVHEFRGFYIPFEQVADVVTEHNITMKSGIQFSSREMGVTSAKGGFVHRRRTQNDSKEIFPFPFHI
jgi:hypothetical protein